MSTDYSYINKFPEFSDTSDNILVKCDCKSAAAVTAAGGVVGGAGTPDYNDDGVLLAVNLELDFKDALSAAEKIQMEGGFTLTCWIESGFFDDDYKGGSLSASGEYVLNVKGASHHGFWKGNNSNVPRIRKVSSYSWSSKGSNNLVRGSHVRVDMVKIGSYTTVYADYYPLIVYQDGALQANPFAAHVGIGSGGNNSSPQVHRIKDFMVSTHPVSIPISYDLIHVSCFGMSYLELGDYNKNEQDGLASLSYSSISTTPGSGGSSLGFDEQLCPVIHKRLNQAGLGMGGGRLYNHAKGGMKLSTATGGFDWQIAQAIATQSNIITTAIVWWGANEVVASSGDWDDEYGPTGSEEDWETLYQAQIDALIALGATKILLLNQPYLSQDHPSASGAAYVSRVDGCNRMIDSLVAANDECHLINTRDDVFGGSARPASAWGGFDGTDPAHPSLVSSNGVGELCFQELIRGVGTPSAFIPSFLSASVTIVAGSASTGAIGTGATKVQFTNQGTGDVWIAFGTDEADAETNLGISGGVATTGTYQLDDLIAWGPLARVVLGVPSGSTYYAIGNATALETPTVQVVQGVSL